MIKQFFKKWLGIEYSYNVLDTRTVLHINKINTLEEECSKLKEDISLLRKNYDILNTRTLSYKEQIDELNNHTINIFEVEHNHSSKIASVENSITQLEAQVKDLSKLANDAMAWSKVCEAKLNKLGEYKPECTKECKTKAVPKTNSLGSVRKPAPKTTKKSK